MDQSSRTTKATIIGIIIIIIIIIVFACIILTCNSNQIYPPKIFNEKFTGICPEGSFRNEFTDKCYKCPDDYIKYITPENDSACLYKNSCSELYPGSSKKVGDLVNCYKCPDTYNKVLFENEKGECLSKYPCDAKYANSFEHFNSGKCYRCPNNYVRTLLHDIDGDKACQMGLLNPNYSPATYVGSL